MLYQRRIADNQVLSAKLELHLRGSRYAGVGTQLLGIVSLGLAGFYSLDPEVMLTWATSLLLLNFWWSRRINRTLQTGRHFTQRPSVFNELIVHAAVSGAIWGARSFGSMAIFLTLSFTCASVLWLLSPL
ncbi:MAG: hypothetical protein HOJ80_04620 [Halieaceae bacterium]|nr:hypothetical protein [Halieaceae bacterium]